MLKKILHAMSLLVTVAWLLPVTNLLAVPEISVTYSLRRVADGEVDPDVPEGSILVTFTSEGSGRPIDPFGELEPVSPTEWRHVFPWNWSPLEIRFFDASTETVTVASAPLPVLAFEPGQHDIPVIHVQTDSTNLWDPEVGLYVFGNHDNCLQRGELWERPAQWQYFDQSATPAIDEPIGLRINGGTGRRYAQKGLRFYFDDYGTADQIEYDFFDGPPISFRRLVIRPGRSISENISTGIFDNLFADQGHLVSRWAAVGVYLNREYWGYYSLRERIDEQFIEHTYDLADDHYVLIKDGESVHGDPAPWWEFLDSCAQEQPFDSRAWYGEVERVLDLPSYIDWLLINIYGATSDNGSQYNLALCQVGNSPWSFIPWDEDGLLNWYNFESDYFRFLSVGSVQEYYEFLPHSAWSGTPHDRVRWGMLFRSLMQNSVFKARFTARYLEMKNGPMSNENMSERLENLVAIQEAEMCRHLERWKGHDCQYYLQVAAVKQNWIDQRWDLLDPQFEAFRELYRVPVELSRFVASLQGPGQVELTWRTESQEQVAGFVLFGGSDAENLQEIASWHDDASLVGAGGIWQGADYSFTDLNAETEADSLYYQLVWEDQGGTTTPLNWRISLPTRDPPQLFINEFLANNTEVNCDETGEYEDWLEIYNAGPGTAQLGGLYLTDDLTVTTKWALPDYQLEAGDHLLVWCDADPLDGPFHATFKLSASGEAIGLFGSSAQGCPLLDSIVFGPQTADVSFGRQIDGAMDWVFFDSPSPAAVNGSVAHLPMMSAGIKLEPAFPNPFNPQTEIQCFLPEAVSVRLGVFDVKGNRVFMLCDGRELSAGAHHFSWNGTDETGGSVAAGVYLVQLVTPNQTQTGKLLLVR